MNIIFSILTVIAGIIVLLLLVAAISKKKYSIEREITINRPGNIVFDYIKHLRNQDAFSKWANIDPLMKKEYRGTDATAGFVSAWESDNKNVGKGEQTIKRVVEGEKVETIIHFIKPMDAYADASMSVEPLTNDRSKVKWSFSSSMKYPINIMLLVMNMEKMLGDDLVIGLKNLKTILEKEK